MLKLGKQRKTLLDIPVNQFIQTGQFHALRGQYVLDAITRHHRASMKRIKEVLPNVSISSSIPISNSFLIVASKEDLDKLEKLDDVVEIHGNDGFKINLPTLKTEKSQSDTRAVEPDDGIIVGHGFLAAKSSTGPKGLQWNVQKIGADRVWALNDPHSRGEGIIYAIADTGCEFTHPNINGNYMGRKPDGMYDHNYAWYDGVRRPIAMSGQDKCGIASNVPCDDQGHGTHVASTAVGANGFGVAPGARWIACRNMDRGVGSPETYLNCLNFFLAPHDLNGNNPRPELRPHVVGNSYGCPDSEGCSKLAMNAAVEALRSAGVFMSVSAGNEGSECGTIANPPALEKSVITVGATDSNDNLADFSSRGPCVVGKEVYRKPDLCAPGVRVQAAYPGGGYRSLSGTSMASPHVGGAATLICALCPSVCRNVDHIQELLQKSARPLFPARGARLCGGDTYSSYPNNHYGYGRINVYDAICLCRDVKAKPINYSEVYNARNQLAEKAGKNLK